MTKKKLSTLEKVDKTGSSILRWCGVVISITIVCNLVGSSWITFQLAKVLGMALLTFVIIFFTIWVFTQGAKGLIWSATEIVVGQEKRYWPNVKAWFLKKFEKKPKPAPATPATPPMPPPLPAAPPPPLPATPPALPVAPVTPTLPTP